MEGAETHPAVTVVEQMVRIAQFRGTMRLFL